MEMVRDTNGLHSGGPQEFKTTGSETPILHYALGCILVRFVSKNARKKREKHNWLVFLPNVWCNIETLSRVFLTLGNFLAFLRVFYTRKNARKNKKRKEKKTRQ